MRSYTMITKRDIKKVWFVTYWNGTTEYRVGTDIISCTIFSNKLDAIDYLYNGVNWGET